MKGVKTVVIIGAGKIGRSFIGQLFGLSGYQVVFVDINMELVRALNQRESYPVVIKGGQGQTIIVPNVRAVSGLDREQAAIEVSKASVLAVSVGKDALEKVIPLIAEGLKIRYRQGSNNALDIIIAENMRSAAEFVRERLSSCLPAGYPIDRLVGLVEASIGKMVPAVPKEIEKKDPLLVYAEPYNTLILDKNGFKNPVPKVKGLSPKGNIKAWVDRKLFIHNLGHAAVAYFGAFCHPGAVYIYEVLNDKKVYQFTKEVMLQAASVLYACYPEEFSLRDLEIHIEDLLNRFGNKTLGDTVFRVGQDLPRKLGQGDRFVGIIRMAEKQGMSYDKILEAMTYAFFFKATDENGERSESDTLFEKSLSNGLEYTLQKVCGFEPVKDRHLVNMFKKYYRKVNSNALFNNTLLRVPDIVPEGHRIPGRTTQP